jgi:hypothetical protein
MVGMDKSPQWLCGTKTGTTAAQKNSIPKKMNAVVSRGAMPMVTWEPWDYTKGVNHLSMR